MLTGSTAFQREKGNVFAGQTEGLHIGLQLSFVAVFLLAFDRRLVRTLARAPSQAPRSMRQDPCAAIRDTGA